MAEYERGGAALERRWAELVDSTTPNGTTCAAESVIAHARQGAKDLSAMLTRTATALERTAERARAQAAQWLKASGSPTG